MNPPVSGSPASSGGRPGGQSAPSAGLEVTIAHIGLTPEDHLKQDRLDPGGVHGLDLLRSGPALGQERPQGGGDRHQQGENMAQRDVVGGVGPVGPVLPGAGVPQADLVLVVEPGLVVGGPGGIEDPFPKRRRTAASRCGLAPTNPYQTSRISSTWGASTAPSGAGRPGRRRRAAGSP